MVGTLENVPIPSSKPYISLYPWRITELTFGSEITTPEKF